jgi:hypothetical protein
MSLKVSILKILMLINSIYIKKLNMNIGKLNAIMANDQTLNESKFNDYIKTIKNSEILLLEFKTISNIENKFIENDIVASKYIDNNIKLFEVYTIDELENEHNKLNRFNDSKGVELSEEKDKLYNAIITLIRENIKSPNDIDVNKQHDAYELILEHIKKPKLVNENIEKEDNFITENIIQIATNKFNEKYSTFSENDKQFFNNLITLEYNDKLKIFEEYKTEILSTLNEINNTSENPNLQTAIDKLNTMEIDGKSINENLIKLHEFKNKLM